MENGRTFVPISVVCRTVKSQFNFTKTPEFSGVFFVIIALQVDRGGLANYTWKNSLYAKIGQTNSTMAGSDGIPHED